MLGRGFLLGFRRICPQSSNEFKPANQWDLLPSRNSADAAKMSRVHTSKLNELRCLHAIRRGRNNESSRIHPSKSNEIHCLHAIRRGRNNKSSRIHTSQSNEIRCLHAIRRGRDNESSRIHTSESNEIHRLHAIRRGRNNESSRMASHKGADRTIESHLLRAARHVLR